MKRAGKLRALSLAAREAKAAELLNPDVVLTRAAEAASQGAEFIRISLEVPFDLRQTQAAQELHEKLVAEGFKVSWDIRQIPAKSNVTGADLTVNEPTIRWDSDQ